MVSIGGYDKIYMNRSLSTTGVLEGNYLRPDIIGRKFGSGFDMWEIASISQRGGGRLEALIDKVASFNEISAVRAKLIPWGSF